MTRPIRSNPNINGARHFKEVLDAIDFERLSKLGKPLYARAMLYCADKEGMVRSYSEYFEGELKEEAGHLILPMARLIARGRINGQVTELYLGQDRTTLDLLKEPNSSKNYEFRIDGNPSNEYESIKLFKNSVLPVLAGKNSLGYNPNHTSVAWFYLSDDKAKPHQVPLLMISGSLEVLTDSVGEVKVFTQKDLERFTSLRGSSK